MRIEIRGQNAELARRARVWVNETEVTNDCYAVDDEEGWAACYAKDEHGRHYANEGVLVTEILRGDVRIEIAAMPSG